VEDIGRQAVRLVMARIADSKSKYARVVVKRNLSFAAVPEKKAKEISRKIKRNNFLLISLIV